MSVSSRGCRTALASGSSDHVDADYCKRIVDAGYKNYYLPTATVTNLHHKGGTMVSPRMRFRSLLSFHRDSYINFRKHLRHSAWFPMRILVVIGLVCHFLALAAVQASAELVSAMRALVQSNRLAS
jgi:GT2 family glycosyltransferase